MKKLITLIGCLFIAAGTFSQSVIPSVMPIIPDGMEQILSKNPLVLQQIKDSSGNWVHRYAYWRIPSAFEGYTQEKRTDVFESNQWQNQQMLKDSIIGDAQNRISVVYEDQMFQFGGNLYRQRSKSEFQYNADSTINKIAIYNAAAPTYSNFILSYNIFMFYNANKQRIKDSMNYSGTPYVYHYIYNTEGLLENQYTFSNTSDTIGKDFYTYENGKLKIYNSYQFNTQSDDWELSGADTLSYNSEAQMEQHIIYTWASINGAPPAFQPVQNEKYKYDNQDNLLEWETHYFDDNIGEWKKAFKYIIDYDANNKATIGYSYDVNIATDMWDTIALGRFLFAFPTGIEEKSIITTDNIKIYPNPAQDFVYVTGINNDSKIMLTNIAGKEMEVTSQQENNSLKLDLGGISKGIYVLKIYSGNDFLVKRILKE